MSLLELAHVGYTVGDHEILHDVTLTIEANEVVTFAGPSGSGKSTLARIIASLISKTSGELRFEGKAIEDYDPIAYRRQVSYAFQQPTLFGDTVRDNLSFPYQVRKQSFDEQRATQALEDVQLAGYLDKPVLELSGGERQRVALLRNVMIYPKVLILDEVTAGLDAANKALVQQMLTRFNEVDHITMITITHDDDELRHAKRIVTIEQGRIKEGD